jgi:hypothetical protein
VSGIVLASGGDMLVWWMACAGEPAPQDAAGGEIVLEGSAEGPRLTLPGAHHLEVL